MLSFSPRGRILRLEKQNAADPMPRRTLGSAATTEPKYKCSLETSLPRF